MNISYDDMDQDGLVDGTDILESTLKMYWKNEVTGSWVACPLSITYTDSNYVRGGMRHFTEFAIFGTAAAANLDNLIIYPNPFKPTDGDIQTGIDFSATDPNSGIIFNNLSA